MIGPDGTVYPTVEEKEVEVGFFLTRNGASEETPGYRVTVPAAELTAAAEAAGFPEPFGTIEAAEASETGRRRKRKRFRKIPGHPLRQRRRNGAAEAAAFFPGDGGRILVDETWQEEAPEALSSCRRRFPPRRAGRILPEERCGSFPERRRRYGREIFTLEPHRGSWDSEVRAIWCEIRPDGVILLAQEKNGLIWGVNTLCQLLETKGAGAEATGTAETGTAGAGTEGAETNGFLRRHPGLSALFCPGLFHRYRRRMVSMEMLREMVLELSAKR